MQIDGESKDSGLLTSQENLPEHLAKLGHSGRSTEGTQRSLASQTLNQIVQKAVLLNNNGQNMVQIDLKPDILGQIRMQIMTESQQVAVRIVAELPIVKDMLESNLNQLKAELQAQGLQVDELEVSVAHDSRAEDDRYQKAAELRRARASRNNHISAEEETESQKAGTRILRDGMAQTAVDYFA
jgi:flagellar hook-length control protein FliK